MNEIYTCTNDKKIPKLSIYADKTHQFTIQSFWIEGTCNSNTNCQSNTSIISNKFDHTITARINEMKLQLLVESDSGENGTLPNELYFLVEIHKTTNNILATCNKYELSNIISNKAGYILLRNDTENIIRTKFYYAKESDSTVLSSTAIT